MKSIYLVIAKGKKKTNRSCHGGQTHNLDDFETPCFGPKRSKEIVKVCEDFFLSYTDHRLLPVDQESISASSSSTGLASQIGYHAVGK
ncbi:hypothetical protein RRG08_053932 [Elysia crispata]|uniref:Uncharacterized protein n=1 Tax=Elysia crispata TaxID=231223 RepID=A0AAE0ZFF9_9GAST|nr:hypothetical protein RRG08_053932 [Elysia crispata]